MSNFPKLARHSLGVKIECEFTILLERLFMAAYVQKDEKRKLVVMASAKCDLIKFFLRVAWELEYIDHKKYAELSTPINDIGKMIGGWLKMLPL